MLRPFLCYPTPLSQSMRAALERVTQITIVVVLNRLVGLLIPDICSNLSFIQAHGTEVIATRPKSLPSKVLQAAIFLRQYHGTFAFDVLRMLDTEYLGGIARHMWICSTHDVPSTTSTSWYSHKQRRIIPNFLRSFLYTIPRRFFGMQTIWYLHSQTVRNRFCFPSCTVRTDWPCE
jgi:hypothetical protein